TSPCGPASSEPYGSSPVVTAVVAMPIARRNKVRSSAVTMTMSARQATAAMPARRPADGVFSARSRSRRDLGLILPRATRAAHQPHEVVIVAVLPIAVHGGQGDRREPRPGRIWMPLGLSQQHAE